MTTSVHTAVDADLDADLSRRALAGDHDAFQELFRRHEGGLLNVALRMTGNREDAADITQEAFLRVFARLGTLGERGEAVNLPAYLHRTAKNLVYDHSGRRAREIPDEDVERAVGEDDDADVDPERAGLIAAQVAEVRAANGRLAERHRLVLALREVEGMGYEDIGEVLGMTPAAVGQLLVRARLALRRELRMEQVDLDALSPEVRDRVGDIAALVDRQLDEDRTQVTDRLLAASAEARSVKRRFEEVGERYRMWLPLLPLGLGAGVARAAEARDLLPAGPARRPGAGGAHRRTPGRGMPRRTLVAAAGAVILLVTATTTAVVSMPEASPEGTSPAGSLARAEAGAVAVPAEAAGRVVPVSGVPGEGSDAGAPADPSAPTGTTAPGSASAPPGPGAVADATPAPDAGGSAPATADRGSQEPTPVSVPPPASGAPATPPPPAAAPGGDTGAPSGSGSPAATPPPAPGGSTGTTTTPAPAPPTSPPSDPKDPTGGTDPTPTPAPGPTKIPGPTTITTPIIVKPPTMTIPKITIPKVVAPTGTTTPTSKGTTTKG